MPSGIAKMVGGVFLVNLALLILCIHIATTPGSIYNGFSAYLCAVAGIALAIIGFVECHKKDG